jgi:hypothetical protein
MFAHRSTRTHAPRNLAHLTGVLEHGSPPARVRLCMISTVVGATCYNGGSLGATARAEVLDLLRSVAEVVLVGAGTVGAEHYGPASIPSLF